MLTAIAGAMVPVIAVCGTVYICLLPYKAIKKGAKTRRRVKEICLRAKLAKDEAAKQLAERCRKVTCTICAESKVLYNNFAVNEPCGHKACKECYRQYMATDAPVKTARMRTARKFTVNCMMCPAALNDGIVNECGPVEFVQLRGDLRKRARLLSRVPSTMKPVECTKFSCCGVAYDDGKSDNCMCFVCEESWNVPRPSVVRYILAKVSGVWDQAGSNSKDKVAIRSGANGYRPCPQCGTAILKNGGCSHMVCAGCGTRFNWNTFSNRV